MAGRARGILASLEEKIRENSIGLYRAELIKLSEELETSESQKKTAEDKAKKVLQENEKLRAEVEKLSKEKDDFEKTLREKSEENATLQKLVEKQQLQINEQRQKVEKLEISSRQASTTISTRSNGAVPKVVIKTEKKSTEPSSESDTDSSEWASDGEVTQKLKKKTKPLQELESTAEMDDATGDEENESDDGSESKFVDAATDESIELEPDSADETHMNQEETQDILEDSKVEEESEAADITADISEDLEDTVGSDEDDGKYESDDDDDEDEESE